MKMKRMTHSSKHMLPKLKYFQDQDGDGGDDVDDNNNNCDYDEEGDNYGKFLMTHEAWFWCYFVLWSTIFSSLPESRDGPNIHPL